MKKKHDFSILKQESRSDSLAQQPPKHPALLLVIFSLGYIMAVLDTTGVGLAIPHIAKNYQASIVDSTWIINTYILAIGSFLMFAGSFTMRFGAKKSLILGMTIFTIASLACSFSPNLIFLVFVRFVQGFGAALFMPASLALLYTSFPDEQRRAGMLGIWSAIIAVATGTGSLIGGTLISTFGWQSIFLLNLPLGLLTIFAVLFWVKPNQPDVSIKINLRNHLLLVILLSALITYLICGQQSGWVKEPWIYALIITIATTILLFWAENKSQNPIIPKVLIKNKAFLVANFLGLIINISLYSTVLILGLYFQNIQHLSAKNAGAALLPGMILLVVGSLYYTKAVKKSSPHKLIKIATTLALGASIGILLLLTFSAAIHLWKLLALFSLIGLGVGILTPAATTLLMNSAGEEYAGTAGATLNANKQIGGLFGTVLVSLALLQFKNNWLELLSTVFFLNILLYFCALIAALVWLKD